MTSLHSINHRTGQAQGAQYYGKKHESDIRESMGVFRNLASQNQKRRGTEHLNT